MSHAKGNITVRGKVYELVTIDFETFYDKGYTLSGKINTSEYIRDPKFSAHGVGIKIGTKKAQWFTGANIPKALKQIDWSKSAVVGHNISFDGFILSEVYGHIPAFYIDTLGMARAAHSHHTRHDLDTMAKIHGFAGKVKGKALVDTKGKTQLTPAELAALGGYCINDVDDTFGIFWKMYPHIPEDEMRLIDLTVRMFCDPVLDIDIPRVEAELHKEMGAKASALLVAGASVDDLMSNIKFADLLRKEGATVPEKISPTTGKIAPAFAKSDLAYQDLLHHENPKVRALANARLKIKSTIGETRAVRFLEAGKDGKKLPILLNYAGAHTHRWSGGNKMNLQNLVRGGELRRSILAPKGHAVVVQDSAQIEARVLAWLAGQQDLVQAFANKEDVYKTMASATFQKPIDQITKDERFVGKVCVLALGYGMGPVKFLQTLLQYQAQGAVSSSLVFTETECKRIHGIYRMKNPQIRLLWSKLDDMIDHMCCGIGIRELGPLKFGKRFVQLPNKLFLQYFGLTRDENKEASYLTRHGKSKIYGGLLTENVVQALARCIIAEQMLTISEKYRVVTMTHDEIVCVAPIKQADACQKFMNKVMSTPPAWAKGLPLSAEGGWDVCYSK